MGLTKSQEYAFDKALEGKNIFITGGGGVGKSYLVSKIVEAMKADEKNVLITASTGKAATLIGGVTCHRAFKIPVKMTWLATPSITKDSPIYEADVILIDEVSMLRIDAFEFIIKSVEAVNELRESEEYITNPENTHMEPIQIISVGDFCQLPPVIVHTNDGSPDEGDLLSEHFGFDIGLGYAFSAPGWARSKFITCQLTEVMRQTDSKMIYALTGIRFGERTALSYFSDYSRKKKFSIKDDVVYLCGKNKTAEKINNTALARIPGRSRNYYAESIGQVSEQDKQAPDLLKLKAGAQVIMVQNSDKYRNGSAGIITETFDDYVVVRISETGEEISIPYYTWNVERYVVVEKNGKKTVEKEVIGSFSQLPLRLGYAITIHKSQGQTFEKVSLVIGSDDQIKNAKSTRPEIFAFGQLYVALSRVKTMKGLYIEGNLELVDKLAAPEVLRFYNDVLKPVKKEKENPQKAEKKKAKDLAVLHCSKKNVAIAWTFAKSLSSDSTLSGTDIYIPEKYLAQAERFIKVLQK